MSAPLTPSGILLIEKEKGISSFDVLRKLKRLKISQAGHCGTLDPFATGLLIVVCGKMTKFSDFFMHQRKKYTAIIQLGIQTDTADHTGKEIKKFPLLEPVSVDKLNQIASSLHGKQKQLPPMYSAIKKNGVPLYELARKGIEIEREERDIEIFEISLCAEDLSNSEFPTLMLQCEVSSGTYIRTLAETIAARLETVGHLLSLRRTESAKFLVNEAFPSTNLTTEFSVDSLIQNPSQKSWIPFETFLENFSTCTLDARLTRLASNGFPGIFSDPDFLDRIQEKRNEPFLILTDDQRRPIRILRKNSSTQQLDYFISFDSVLGPN